MSFIREINTIVEETVFKDDTGIDVPGILEIQHYDESDHDYQIHVYIVGKEVIGTAFFEEVPFAIRINSIVNHTHHTARKIHRVGSAMINWIAHFASEKHKPVILNAIDSFEFYLKKGFKALQIKLAPEITYCFLLCIKGKEIPAKYKTAFAEGIKWLANLLKIDNESVTKEAMRCNWPCWDGMGPLDNTELIAQIEKEKTDAAREGRKPDFFMKVSSAIMALPIASAPKTFEDWLRV